MATPRMMPHNLEAEQSLLGCVLIDSNTATSILSELKPEDFYMDSHKKIFAAMITIYSGGTPVDFVTVTDELLKVNMLDSVGGIDYVTTLTNIVPSSANFMHYVNIVKRDSILRQLISACASITELAYDNPEKQDVLQFAEKQIFDISKKGDKTTLEHIGPSLTQVLEKFEVIQKDRGSLKGIPTGFHALDRVTNGLQRSDLILVAARPGVGKTSFTMNIVTNAALQGYKAAIFSLEMPKIQIAQRCLCSVACVDMGKALKGDLNSEEWSALWTANKKLAETKIFVDDNSMTNPVDILSKCRRLKSEYGLDLIMIDYLQLMSAPASKGSSDNRQLEISGFTRALKIAARELDVPILLLSQLNRAVESRKDHTPMLADLRESGSIEQDADIVMFINKPDMYPEYQGEKNLCDIIIAKHRNGSLENIKLRWKGEYTTFVNLDSDSNRASLESTAPPKEKNNSEIITDLPPITSIDEGDILNIF